MVLMAVVALGVVSGCTTDLNKHALDRQISPVAAEQQESLKLTKSIHSSLPHGLSMRKLSKGSQWVAVGSVSEGMVYKPLNGVSTVQSGAWSVETHEAFLVISDRRWVGVYLPVSGKVVLLDQPLDLNGG